MTLKIITGIATGTVWASSLATAGLPCRVSTQMM